MPRLSTDYTGTVQRTEGVLMGPFGDNFTETLSTLDFTGFAGGFWDSENNGEHFGAREYQNTHGSWLSPDPAGLAAVDITNPQTWNRYAYVADNPTSYVDPSGLFKVTCRTTRSGELMCVDSGWDVFGMGFPNALLFPNAPSGSGWAFNSYGGSDGALCGESVGLPCGLPIDMSVWNILGLDLPCVAGYNCAPIFDAGNSVNCQTLLPNGQTVGDVVRQQRAALRNAMIPGTNIDNLPTINLLSTFASIARPGGPIDFKNNFKGQANPNVLASAGNFAYYAIGSGNLSTSALDGDCPELR